MWVKIIRKLERFISLNEIKLKQEIKNMVLLKNSRLSVQPVLKEEFECIMACEK
jgi:predicted RNA-binding protein with PUA-like domain